MKDYILADINRLIRRVPRIVLLVLAYIAAVLFLVYSKNSLVWNSVSFISSFATCFSIIGMAICLIEFLFVYASDFKAKVMQVAIGRGISRPRVVLSKFLEVGIMDIMSLVILCVIAVIFGLATGVHMNGEQAFELAVTFLMTVAEELIYTAVTSIFLFLLQNAGLAALIYLIVGLDPISYLLAFLSPYFKLIVSLHLRDYCYGTVCGLFRANLILGKFNFLAFFIILVYLVAAYLITTVVFRKKELEF